MSLAILYSRAQVGMEAVEVRVEVHLANGLPSLSIVGLPETEVKESKDRVRAALLNSQFEFPARRVTINLAPADLPKEGGRYDLPIALGILVASGQLPALGLDQFEFLGELGLSGELRKVRAVLPAAARIRDAGRCLVLSQSSAEEALLVDGARILAPRHLLDVCAHFSGGQRMGEQIGSPPPAAVREKVPDLGDISGQHQPKRALEIAAAGGHSILFVGPPGTGKTMLAARLPGILPPLTEEEALESAMVASVSGSGLQVSRWGMRPFRAPHHTASAVALVGGGSTPKPGEISLAHLGVMFLDELPEFSRQVLEVLREPLESGSVTISRAARQAEFPARFQLLAAMNPCPCGYLGEERCTCTPHQIRRYRAKISGPLLDRIDLHVPVPRLSPEALRTGGGRGELSAPVRERVVAARERQLARQPHANNRLNAGGVTQFCRLGEAEQALLETAMHRLQLSARAYHRILRVARTIADLAGSDSIGRDHLSEAISYRSLDRMQRLSEKLPA